MFSVGGSNETKQHKDKMNDSEIEMLLCDLVLRIFTTGLFDFLWWP